MTDDHGHREDLDDIQRTLWLLLAELREGTVEAEVGEQMISAIDSLIDVARLEGELKRSAAEDDAGKKARAPWRRS